MKKLSALILTLLILMLAGCKSNATESGTVSDFQSDTAVIKNSSTAETDNSSSEEISSKDESITDTANINSVNSSVNSKNNSDNNSAVSKTEKPSVSNNSSTNEASEPVKNQYKTIDLRVKTTYYGYEGYFDYANFLDSDVCLVELGLSSENLACAAPSEYSDIDSGKGLCFVMYNDSNAVIKIKDIAYNHVYPAGAGKTPVKVTNAKKYEKFNQPLNEYLTVSNCYDGSISSYVNIVDIYTVGVNAKVEEEIKSVFYNNFGYYPSHSYNCYSYGFFSIDDSGKPYQIYRYTLSDTVKDK